jgi:RHS repeat-associated protein
MLWAMPQFDLYHVRARVYSPKLGRFMQSDPAGYSDGMNYYAFVHNDPINNSDPTGLICGQPGAVPDPTLLGQTNLQDPVAPTEELVVQAPCTPPEYLTVPVPNYQPPPAITLPGIPNVNLPTEGTGTPHKYVITVPTDCSPENAFNQLKEKGMSAPGAPAAQEDFTPSITLWGDNPISQTVNSNTMTITNTTLPGHEFYPGSVVIQVSPGGGGGSTITITGTGTGPHPGLNQFLGQLIFGLGSAGGIATSCSYSPI